MKKPENVIESMAYIEPHAFESDREATIFYSYFEQIAYIDYLEEQLGNVIQESDGTIWLINDTTKNKNEER